MKMNIGSHIHSFIGISHDMIFTGIEYSLVGAPHCPDTYGLAVSGHPEYCDKFYKCENGTLTLETCENGLLFDGKGAVHNHCNYNWAVHCDKRLADSKWNWFLKRLHIF